jgi:hypothetical protein
VLVWYKNLKLYNTKQRILSPSGQLEGLYNPLYAVVN